MLEVIEQYTKIFIIFSLTQIRFFYHYSQLLFIPDMYIPDSRASFVSYENPLFIPEIYYKFFVLHNECRPI